MEKTEIAQLNHEWRAFIESYRLYILLNESEELLRFLSSIRFFAPSKFPSYADGIKRMVSVEFTGEKDNLEIVTIAIFFKKNTNGGTIENSDWRILKKNPLGLRITDFGLGFQGYFRYLNIKKHNFVEELLKEFQLSERLL